MVTTVTVTYFDAWRNSFKLIWWKIGFGRPVAHIRPTGRTYQGGRPYICGRAPTSSKLLNLSLFHSIILPASKHYSPCLHVCYFQQFTISRILTHGKPMVYLIQTYELWLVTLWNAGRETPYCYRVPIPKRLCSYTQTIMCLCPNWNAFRTSPKGMLLTIR